MKYWFTSFLLTLSLLSFGECYYSDVELKIEVLTSDGQEKTIGYQTISYCDFDADSLTNTNYWIRIFTKYENTDSISIFNNRICYYYQPDSLTNDSVFHLLNKQIFSKSNITSIQVLKHFRTNAFDHISTDLSLADSTWIYTTPSERITAQAYLCNHFIFIHNSTDSIEPILEEINALNNTILTFDYEEIQMKGDEYDEKLWKLIDKLTYSNRIVIVSSCTD